MKYPETVRAFLAHGIIKSARWCGAASTQTGEHKRFLQSRSSLKAFACWVVSSCLTLTSVASAAEPAVPPTGISVRDSIEMIRLVDPSPVVDDFGIEKSVKFSPKRTHFAVVTRKDSVDRDTVTAELLVFNVEEVRAFLNASDRVDASLASTVVTMESTPINAGLDRPVGISGLRWLSDSTIAFIGQRGVLPTQVYSVDVLTKELTQLTNHDRHVKQYGVSKQSDTLVFVAEHEGVDHTTRNLRGYAVESGSLYNTLLRYSSKTDLRDEAYFSLDVSTGAVTTLTSPGHSLVAWAGLWVSPNGRWVVSLANVTGVPADWLAQYAPLGGIGRINKHHSGNPALDPRAKNVRQYVLIDTATGNTRPLLHAPVSWGVNSVHWSIDSKSVIVSNTFLPLEDADVEEFERRRKAPYIVEVDIATGGFSPIASYLSIGGRPTATKQLTKDVLIVEYSPPDQDKAVSKVYYRTDHSARWVLQGTETTLEMRPSISVFVAQDVNTPPDIAATDNTSNQTKRITNFNPTLRNRLGSPVEEFQWTDKNGRFWKGGLLYPPNYVPDQRYPLVIQTYGYFPDEFLIDGPTGIRSAYAARPLAGRGIVVLQMHYSPSLSGHPRGPEEGPGFVAAFEAAVYALDERGTIDPARVGLIGFSRAGLHVSYAVAFSDIAFAAATIADSTADGLAAHMQFFGTPPPGMFAQETAMGSPFWGEGRLLWLERSPNMNAHLIRTPLRFEQYGFGLGGYWDVYTVLRRHFRPAEVFHIPFAVHNLQRPQAIYASQQGNVDWFAFWLTDYEDPDPSKVDQYRRWRKLRKEHKVMETGISTARH